MKAGNFKSPFWLMVSLLLAGWVGAAPALAQDPAFARNMPNAIYDADTRHCLDYIDKMIERQRVELSRCANEISCKTIDKVLKIYLETDWDTTAPDSEFLEMIEDSKTVIQQFRKERQKMDQGWVKTDRDLAGCGRTVRCNMEIVKQYQISKQVAILLSDMGISDRHSWTNYAECVLRVRAKKAAKQARAARQTMKAKYGGDWNCGRISLKLPTPEGTTMDGTPYRNACRKCYAKNMGFHMDSDKGVAKCVAP